MENLNLFVKSIFIDNMIFAYFLGMCKNSLWTGYRRDLCTSNYFAGQLSIGDLCFESRRFEMVGSRIRSTRFELPEPNHVYRYYCLDGTIGRNVRRKIFTLPIRLLRNIPAADCRKLRHIGRLAIHATTQLPLCYERDRLRDRFWNRLDARHRMLSGHSRKIKLFKHTGSIARYRYHIYHYRTNGYRLHELFRN